MRQQLNVLSGRCKSDMLERMGEPLLEASSSRLTVATESPMPQVPGREAWRGMEVLKGAVWAWERVGLGAAAPAEAATPEPFLGSFHFCGSAWTCFRAIIRAGPSRPTQLAMQTAAEPLRPASPVGGAWNGQGRRWNRKETAEIEAE